MQAARRHADFDFTSRLGRRAEAGPRRVLPRVRPRHEYRRRRFPHSPGALVRYFVAVKMTSNLDRWKALDEFDALLEDENSRESAWQALFSKYPFVLSHGLALDIAPDALISCKPGRAEADYYFYPADETPASPYGVIEIKRPKMQLLKVPRKDVICLSADATSAVAQAAKYAEELDARVQRTRSGLIVLGNRLHTFVIAGLSQEIAKKVTTDILRERAEKLMPSGCQLVPFDTLAKRLHARTPPRLHVLVPAIPKPTARGTYRSYGQEGGFRRESGFRPRSGGFFGGPREMHKAMCTACSHATLVPFKPIEGRPVFCRDCYMKQKEGRS